MEPVQARILVDRGVNASVELRVAVLVLGIQTSVRWRVPVPERILANRAKVEMELGAGLLVVRCVIVHPDFDGLK